MSVDRSPGQIVPSGWRAVVGVIAAALLVVGIALLLVRAAGFGEVRDATEKAESTWFVVCLGAQLVALSAYAAVFRRAFRWDGAPDPGFRVSAYVMLAGIGATRVFAAGGVGAIAVTYWCFRRARLPAEDAIVRVLGFNALFYVAFGVGVWTAALVTVTGSWGDVPQALALPWLVVVPAIALAAVVATEPARVERLTQPGGAFARRALAYAVAAVAWARSALRDPAGRRMLGATVLYWVGNIACLWASLRSVGETPSFPELALAFAARHAAMILPLPLGGVGGVDAAMTYALTAVGVPLAHALVAVGVYRLFSFWLPTVPALAALPLLPGVGRRLAALPT